MSGKKGTSAKQKGHTTDNKHKTETSQNGKQTPQGGLKRFLTPSPVLINETLKKSRQISGELSDVSEKLNMDECLELETHCWYRKCRKCRRDVSCINHGRQRR